MLTAKQIKVEPISGTDANRIVKRLHYSGKVAPNSQLHFGVFANGRCGGAIQLGPSLKKRNTMQLVRGTTWSGFLELNRMAFAEWLPRNSESRALGYVLRYIGKTYPHIEWVISFADATQSGDGAIYRATGFVLTEIRRNEMLRRNPQTGEVMHQMQAHHRKMVREFRYTWVPLDGYQLRYVYFVNPAARERLTCEVLPFSAIAEAGAGMYRGERIAR